MPHFSLPFPLNMLPCLKKHRKSPRRPVPPENPTHQNTGTGTAHDRDSEGEYRSEKTSGMMRSMGLIRPWNQMHILATEGVLGSHIRTEGLRIDSLPG